MTKIPLRIYGLPGGRWQLVAERTEWRCDSYAEALATANALWQNNKVVELIEPLPDNGSGMRADAAAAATHPRGWQAFK